MMIFHPLLKFIDCGGGSHGGGHGGGGIDVYSDVNNDGVYTERLLGHRFRLRRNLQQA
jgi:hypothetical protein